LSMKCRYRYKAKTLVRLGESFPLEFMDLLFEFQKNSTGLVDEIWVTVHVPDKSMWPSVVFHPDRQIKTEFRMTRPENETVVHILRFLEGGLSFYGLESIDFDDPKKEWLPETDEEKIELTVHSYSSSTERIDISSVPVAKFGLIAQTLYAYADAWDLEPQFNFFRRGVIAIRDERFIDAIYNFYFYLESTFGNGQTRNERIKAEFAKNQDLMTMVGVARDRFDVSRHVYRNLMNARFDGVYRSKTEREIISTIVDLRGFLHHHTSKRKDIWHPSDKWTYSADAFLMQDIVHGLAHNSLTRHAYSEKNLDKFKDAIRKVMGKGTA
jgi:hypothetical protein